MRVRVPGARPRRCPVTSTRRATSIPNIARVDDCTGCRYCLLVCPDTAVQVENKGKTDRAHRRAHREADDLLPRLHARRHPPAGRRKCIDEMGVREHTVGVAPVGCSVLAYDYFNMRHVRRRRTAARRRWRRASSAARPDLIVFTYQGDGDLASIGRQRDPARGQPRREDHGHLRQQRHLRHDRRPDGADDAAGPDRRRPSPIGRDVRWPGYPMRVSELLATLRTPAFIARGLGARAASTHRTRRRLIKKAFEYQLDKTLLLVHRGAVDVPDQLGPVAARVRQVARGER